MESHFKDKVVLVTGAGRGIGRAIAEAFAAQGAIVAANDLTPINLDETLRRIAAAGGRGQEYLFDVAKKMPVQEMIDQIVTEWGRLDILVNNAGVEPLKPLLDMDAWDWTRTVDVNLNGPFFAMQVAGRVMREQGGGVIVNLGAAQASPQALHQRAAFIASKQGLLGLTRAAAAELQPYGIRVNAVCPASGAAQNLPQAVADVVLFLCSPAAAAVTGQAIEVTGDERPV